MSEIIEEPGLRTLMACWLKEEDVAGFATMHNNFPELMRRYQEIEADNANLLERIAELEAENAKLREQVANLREALEPFAMQSDAIFPYATQEDMQHAAEVLVATAPKEATS